MIEIGKNLKTLRINAKMTQEELAAALDVNRSYVAQIERGTKLLSLQMAVDICNELGCTLYDIVSLNIEVKGA